jgi:hypothetical protein
MMVAVLHAVRDAPPPAFSGGGKWEAMHDEMAGFYEVRVDGPQRRHYRLFCLLEQDNAHQEARGPEHHHHQFGRPFQCAWKGRRSESSAVPVRLEGPQVRVR